MSRDRLPVVAFADAAEASRLLAGVSVAGRFAPEFPEAGVAANLIPSPGKTLPFTRRAAG